MSGYAMTSPLITFGPAGVVAWAVTGTILTVGVLLGLKSLKEAVKEDSKSDTKSVALPDTNKPCKRCKWSVRVHAQGGDLPGGTAKSTVGAPAAINSRPITVAEGLFLSKATQYMLEKKQLKIRLKVIIKVENHIQAAPPNGFTGRYGKLVSPPEKGAAGARYDADSFGSTNNFQR